MKLRSIILNSNEENSSLLVMINDAIESLQKIVLPKKLNSSIKSSSVDPFHRFTKLSCNNILEDCKSNVSVSNHHNSSSYPIRSAELAKLPVLTETQNTAKTIESHKASSKKFKL